MPVKIKTNISDLIAFPEEVEREFCRKTSEKRELEAAIVEVIISGTSPVKGERFKQYSKSYAKQKYGSEDQRKPVNMIKSGDMIKSLKAIKERGVLKLKFKGQAIRARYHDSPKGDSNMPERRLLPRDGEEFKASIQRVIIKLLDRAIKRASD